MRFLLKLFLIGTAIVLLIVHREDIANKLSDLWVKVSPPPGMLHPVVQSAQRASAAVNGLMNGVGHAFGH